MADAPDWFWEAIDQTPEDGYVSVDEVELHYLQWGNADAPGLMLVHGHNAHAHWWDFIAPSFASSYHVVAPDLSGMGDSDHRDEYSADLYAEELCQVADAAVLSTNTIVVAHSFGGLMAIRALARFKDRFKGLILLDSGVKHPDDESPKGPERWTKPKVYPDLEVARSRFRLQPPQTCEHEFLVNHIARHSIDAIADGFVWKFDDELNSRMKITGDFEADFVGLQCPISLIYGEQSASFSVKSAEHMRALNPNLKVEVLKAAQHHLFLDQPIEFIAQLKTELMQF
jgi:pimeloyl-ACP methyl ester carboxylesterase